ncbi:uncharacterized protein At3g43530-like [Brassica rapa]|uniref:uncharacterized protein At3g43530-like n=1 Tax=Brassica campestris TaxID=3711 RepID=UPI00142D7A17|nr:uncharacterized protein At3g43530-like [Brassica rapa]XP_018510172.2 uncharacterized protein At3g43530-like [Brassica rapa]XP_018511251.2 uncharacterized protein At3g43530-like [Brassica rapa]XP_033128364.1 uncharacterized protein At3g43530-like [Brassica rapa]XP_033131263.1 uncharacterized protein At3g43530-like [Brassica rapa]XP_033137868.1 uncharacterized protein At3g43530-like [Brassica rapa]XP_033144538.1 uncharacterized protein At3g43530-like [Brassica rapa]
MVETRLGKRKDRPPPTAPPPQKSGTSKNSKKNKPKKSSKKRKTTDEESPAVDFVGTVGVAEENEVEEPAKDVEDREKEKEESEKEKEREEENGDEDEEEEENSDESQEEKDENGDKDEEEEGNSDESQEEKDENGDKDEEEEGNSDEEVENKDEEKIQEEEDTGEEENGTPEENRGQNENENQEQGEPPLEAELGNVDGDGEGVLGQGEEELEATEAIKPLRMYFYESEYKKQIKLATKCFVKDVMVTFDNLEPPMSDTERKWFEKHPQFCHVFHLEKDSNHMVQGMWMLLLRTVDSSKRKEVWFIVNGVPIRYGLREHALISGLSCRNYPLGYKEFGDRKFVKRHFKKGESIRLEDVKAKLLAMGEHRDRLKMMVLFFLGSVICAQTKVGKGARDVLEFFQRAVDDLEFCENFPWGRYSFDYMVKEISHTIDHFGGRVREKTLWPLPGFCLPLELLAFEAIPKLGLKFRKEVEDVDVDCPRMCRSVFKSAGMKGFSLSKLNRELDKLDKITSRDIHSILPTKTEEEVALLEEMTEEEDDVDVDDISVDSWIKRLAEGHSVFFEEMYDVDVAARDPNAQEAVDEDQDDEEGGEEGGASQKKMMEELIKQVKMFGTQLKRVKKTMDKFEERMVVPFEAFMKKAMDEGQGSRE